MKLYIVEDGGDDDVVNRIGVFSSMEKAESVVKRLGSGWELGIVEVELDLVDEDILEFYDKYRISYD